MELKSLYSAALIPFRNQSETGWKEHTQFKRNSGKCMAEVQSKWGTVIKPPSSDQFVLFFYFCREMEKKSVARGKTILSVGTQVALPWLP